MESPNHYELLGVTPDATAAEIRTSYRRLIRIYHPDVAGAAGAAMTLRLNDAQAALLDASLRARLDAQLRSRTPAAPAFAAAGQPGARSAPFHSDPFRSASFHSEPSPQRSSYSPFSTPSVGLVRSAWSVAFAIAAAAIVVVTIIVLAFSYSGPISLVSIRTIPAYVVAVAWLVSGLSSPPKMFVAMLAFGAALWPLTALQVGPFAPLTNQVPPAIWMLLTVLAAAVMVLRLAASRVSLRRLVRTRSAR